nr:N-acetylglucosamine kinase [Clostridia bacterium]
MKYILGVDSGGTKYLVRAMSLEGQVLAELEGEPCRHYQIGEEETVRRINRNMDACLAMFGGEREDCLAIAAAVSGIDSPEDQAILDRIYAGIEGFNCPVTCLNDAEMTHYAVTGGVGVLVIAGTGSIAFGRNSKGESSRVGGWLFTILSDEGSGSYITRKAMFHYSRYLDGCREETPLIGLIKEKLGDLGRKELMLFATDIATPPWKTPSLSVEVNKAAGQGDPYAMEILQDAAQCTFALADELIRKLRLDEEEELRVGVWGSALVKSKLHLGFFTEKIKAKYPDAQVIIPERDAADGACRMALEMAKK